MKKIIILAIIGFLAASQPLSAEDQKEVSLRFGQNENTIRIVLEADDTTIKNASVTASLSGIKVDFSELFILNKQKDFPLETTTADRQLFIKLKDAEDVAFYKLGGPPRIVMDVKLVQKSPGSLKNKLKVQIIERPKQEAKSVFLDAGHGGFDYGLTADEVKEKDLNLLLSNELNAVLAKKGYKVFFTRKADQSVSLLDRILLANSRKPDIFVSVHSSASDAFVIYTAGLAEDIQNSEPSKQLYSLAGRQTRHIESSRALAAALGKYLRHEFGKEVYLRELPLPLLVSMDAPAVLVEYPSLLLNEYDQKTRARFISSVVKGLGTDE
jgi:N-acetylmuramoyl-L-alanine amidase